MGYVTDVRGGDGSAGGTRTGGLPGTLAGAVVLAGLEALALVGVAVLVVVESFTSRPDDRLGSLLQAALCVLVAAVLVGCARGLRRLRAGARTPLLVLQLLALPVAYSLWFQGDGHPQYGAPIAVLALVTIYLLFAPPSREALERAID